VGRRGGRLAGDGWRTSGRAPGRTSRVRGMEGRLPRIRRRRGAGRHPGDRGALGANRRVPAGDNLRAPPDRRVCAGTPAPALRPAQLRPGRRRDQPDGRRADAAAAGDLPAWQAGPDSHARRRATDPRRVRAYASRPTCLAHVGHRPGVAGTRGHPLRGGSSGLADCGLPAVRRPGDRGVRRGREPGC
jgi:hypothetical protein